MVSLRLQVFANLVLVVLGVDRLIIRREKQVVVSGSGQTFKADIESDELMIQPSATQQVPTCTSSITAVIWSTNSALCVPSTGGRVQYFGRPCGSGQIHWTSATALDKRPELASAQCSWNWTTHSEGWFYGGWCGLAPTVNGGSQLPTSCQAPTCTASITATIWSTSSALCVPSTGGRVRYVGEPCGSGQISWKSAFALDLRPGLTSSDCSWDWTKHPDPLQYGGSCGVSPTVNGGNQLPTVCQAPTCDRQFRAIMWSTNSALCVPSTGGRVQYVGEPCGSGQISWKSAIALDVRPGLNSADCAWDWTKHPDKRQYGGDCGVSPTVNGGNQLPTVCQATCSNFDCGDDALKNTQARLLSPPTKERCCFPSGSNLAPPVGHVAKSGSGPCKCQGNNQGLNSCGALCCAASPHTDPDPKGQFYWNKSGKQNDFYTTVCWSTR